MSIWYAVIAVALSMWTTDLAFAHGIAGNRYLVGTLTFYYPAVADEAILPYYSYFANASQLRPLAVTGAVVSQTPIGPAGKALTPNLTTGNFQSVSNPRSKHSIGPSQFNTALTT